ncbi:hypothetical protein K432DRAFT_330482 [Lepidopterella palustris CBS 459.81]|uniref:Histone transcription regulator 3 homolog n=1 Tax=Lepidopterella palustris CBS 459.81 TaxID=1314670 RepID=A0A8E2E8D0_9PEZI|nr:hypothetical protein K432DRAFT_330482 [Lepidopterella palustris CBS 459.81]
MSTFKSLNVESDNESEDEIDDTKEIQIEEALKLYQAALKFHSEGPKSYEQAAEAYKTLFESEIFKYAESLSEYRRHELYGDTLEYDSILQDDFETGPVQLVGATESAPNTLPQILHLSYKNYAQFMLEVIQYHLRQHNATVQEQGPPATTQPVAPDVPLRYFAEALDKDDTDLDLWSRTASVAALVGSSRITRFCLEAVLDGDDEGLETILRLPGLEEGFSGHQLRELVEALQDDLSQMQAPLSFLKRKKLPAALTKRLNPYPFTPLPSEVAKACSSQPLIGRSPARFSLNPPNREWAKVGEAILHQYMTEQSGFIDLGPGPGIGLNLPPGDYGEDGASNESTPKDNTEERVNDSHTSALQPEGLAIPAEIPADQAPQTTIEDIAMQEAGADEVKRPDNETTLAPGPVIVPSRKRSTDSAGLPETAEGGRVRSKRIRARESIVEGTGAADAAGSELAKQMEDQLSNFTMADQYLFEIMNDLLGKLDVKGLGSSKELKDALTGAQPDSPTIPGDGQTKAARDLFTALQACSPKTATVLLSGETVDLGGMSRDAGLSAFLGYAKSGISQACTKPFLGGEGLSKFSRKVNSQWLSVKEVAFVWLEYLLLPGSSPALKLSQHNNQSSYMQYRWPDDLKRQVVQVIVNLDDFIFQRLLDRVSQLDSQILNAQSVGKIYKVKDDQLFFVEMIQTLFELHLDIYSLIRHPNSGVDTTTQTIQRDRLERWAALARDALQLRSSVVGDADLDELTLRHIWASAFHISVCEDVPQEHIIYCIEDLKTIFISLGEPTIEIQNNAVMPELSIAAADRELARISMKDFFMRVFNHDEKDPVAVIESLEPILEPLEHTQLDVEPNINGDDQDPSDSPPTLDSEPADPALDPRKLAQPSPFQEMKKFLDTASVSLRLSMWQRLREAYEAIEYPPKVVSCYLRSIETLVAEFSNAAYEDAQEPDRHFMLISRLRIIDEVLIKILQLVKAEPNAFDCLDYEHLQSSMNALVGLLRIMSAMNVYEDMLRVGQLPAPTYEGCPSGTALGITSKLHDMQLRAWILQYLLLKEGIAQNSSAFPNPSDDKFEYLRHVHYATGIRGFCHTAGKTFLRLVKDELIHLNDVTDGNIRDTEFAQVLYDLYGLKTFTNMLDCMEFGSTNEVLDKRTASQLLPFIMSQAQKINIKDLPKTELKITIDKVHGALGRPKANDDMALNRKVLTSYFKSPVNPVALYRSLEGVGTLSTKYISPKRATAASKGWYFLMGNIALNKFRSQKRVVPGPTEDINFAAAFFIQDLEYSTDRWETWYRLAQANDTQLEEAVSWTAEKLNNNSLEILQFQRCAIHCYTMAVACAVRDADTSPQTVAKVSDMYTDFGNRIYSSSRQPFSMQAFSLKETEQKYFSGQTVYQGAPFVSLRPYTAWKFASVLFRRAIAGKPDKWWNYYMLGKCLWKMHHADEVARGNCKPPGYQEVVDAFVRAIEILPEKKDNRREPILEPHYKLVSIVHKLVQHKEIEPEVGSEILQNTPYAKNLSTCGDLDRWEGYILDVLKSLRAADKSGWHHRMTARSAHVIYDDSSEEIYVAMAAKQELSQQIFTKTMAVQVWKPENERPGRHFVYTSRYTRFFVKLLVQTGDRTNLEALAKRVRKKPHEFFEHSKLWQELCLAYLKLLRRVGKIPEGHEDAVFKSLNHDEFTARSAMLEQWCQQATTQNLILDVLRDVIELKRLNNGLMKSLLIDDLIGDAYAMMYAQIGLTLDPAPQSTKPTQQLQQQPVLPSQPHPASTQLHQHQHPPNVMSLTSMMNTQMDGPADAHQRDHYPQMPFPTEHQRAPHTDPTSRPRNKGVGRRELQRKAEAAVTKPAAPAIPIRSPPSDIHPQVMIPAQPLAERMPGDSMSAPPGTGTGPGPGQLQVPAPSAAAAALAVGGASVESSAPASMHDSADDESELSELEDVQDEVIVRPMFPNLMANKTAESSVVGSSAATPEPVLEEKREDGADGAVRNE